jgi:hypothetical protein
LELKIGIKLFHLFYFKEEITIMNVITKFIIIPIVLILMLLSGCKNNTKKISNNRPKLKVSFENKTIDPIKGTNSWTIENKDGTRNSVTEDSISPKELVKRLDPLIVPPKAEISLDFDYKPSDINVRIWNENGTTEEVISDNKILVPESKGQVIYEIIAKWKEGTVSYAFLINVN